MNDSPSTPANQAPSHHAGASTTHDLYVNLKGDDHQDGSRTHPVASLARARDLAGVLAGRATVTVHVADGVYYLPDTLTFTPKDSGTDQHPITYRADNPGGAVLSGGSLLKLDWSPYRDGIFRADTPAGLTIDQLFVNGTNQRMARYPDFDPQQTTAAYQGFAADALSKERAARWQNPKGGYIHAMHRSRWGGYHYQITGKDEHGELTYEGGWQNNRPSEMHPEFRMVENIFEELDAPGEWFHDAKDNTLYYIPQDGTDLSQAAVEVVRLRHLIAFHGDSDRPVKYIAFEGFTFRHAARTFMDTKEPLLRSDWAIYRGGAAVLSGTEDVSMLDCEFDQVGGNAVFVDSYNRRALIKGCHIHDAGASGVCFVGDHEAVRDPLFRYEDTHDLAKIDRAVGPKTNNYPADCAVDDCLIHGIGRVERQPAGVQIEMAMRIAVRDTSIYDTARAGINIGSGCWGGHLIERCDVFDTVLETHDHGSFNSWGRDRFWQDNCEVSQQAIDQDSSLPFLDAMQTNVIRDSRWRCDHGWDIDLDDGSSNYEIYNNLMLNGGLKLREGFRRKVWNNITVNNGLHPHVWYRGSDDEFFSNIVMRSASGVRTPTSDAPGKLIDRNLFYTAQPKDKDKYAEFGWDVNSLHGDANFIDPTIGDYTVNDESPAFAIGFKNIPMDQFGVKKPDLRIISRTPTLPTLELDTSSTSRNPWSQEYFWMGAKLHTIEGDEYSAYGTRQEDGGVALEEVPDDSAAAAAGLKANDLIQAFNHRPIRTADELIHAATENQAAIEVKLVRLQKEICLTVRRD